MEGGGEGGREKCEDESRNGVGDGGVEELAMILAVTPQHYVL